MLRKFMASSLRFINGKLVLPNGTLQDGILSVKDGVITSIVTETSTSSSSLASSSSASSSSASSASTLPGASTSSTTTKTIDLQGNIIAPGYIDMQWNGGYNIDFSDNDLTEEGIISALEKLLVQTGVVAVNPTIISSPREIYERNIPIINAVRERIEKENIHCTRLLGLHLEGPYLHSSKRGAHMLNNLRIPQTVTLSTTSSTSSHTEVPSVNSETIPLQALAATYGTSFGTEHFWERTKDNCGNVDMVTLAPELPGSSTIIEFLTQRNVIPSIGHTTASFDTGKEAVLRYGARMITHLFNAMPPLHHRDPGIVGLVGDKDLTPSALRSTLSSTTSASVSALPLFYGVIADGVHVHPSVLRLIYQSNSSACINVTDAMRAMGLGPGRHTYANEQIDVFNGAGPGDGFYKGKHAVVAGTNGTLAGAVVTLDECVRNFRAFTNCSIPEAIATVTKHPAQLLRREKERGTLTVGARADFVILDKHLTVIDTYVNGESK